MKNLIELNKEIETIFKPEIYIFNEYKNIMFNERWVNEIFDNKNYFYDWEQRIVNKINNTVDLDNSLKIKFIKVFHQDVLEKYNELSTIDYESLEYLKTFKLSFLNIKKPENFCSEFYSSSDDFEYGDFLEKMSRIFEIEDYNYNDGEYDSEKAKDILEDEIMFKLHDGEKSIVVIEEIEETTYLYQEKDLAKIDSYYSYGFLSYCLENARTLLKNIVRHLDNLVNLIRKLENFEDDKLTLEDILVNDLTDIKLEYKLSKMEVALFYRALHDVQIINVNNQGQKHPYTNLKKYINSSNMYYFDNKKTDKVKNINKEFSKFLNDNKYEKQEIELLEFIMKKLNSRIEYINKNHEEGLF
jgi:hypothetical protein